MAHAFPSRVLGTIGKPSTRRDTWALFPGVWTYDVKDIELKKNYELKKLENYFYFYFGCSNGTRHTSLGEKQEELHAIHM